MDKNERFKLIMKILEENDIDCNFRNMEFFDRLPDDELCDSGKIFDLVTKNAEYEKYLEDGSAKYSENIMQSVRQNIGYDKYDFSHDKEIEEMDRDTILRKVCVWNGFRGSWEDSIKDWIENIYKVKLEN